MNAFCTLPTHLNTDSIAAAEATVVHVSHWKWDVDALMRTVQRIGVEGCCADAGLSVGSSAEGEAPEGLCKICYCDYLPEEMCV